MPPSLLRALRLFVAASLLLGGIALLAGARVVQEWATVPTWVVGLVVLWVAGLAALAGLERTRPVPWQAVAAAPILSLMLGVTWGSFDPTGHLVLSGLAPFVALLTGFSMLQRRRWAWPVAFASVTGFGPIVLLFAPLPQAAILGASALFLADAVALLALAESFFEKPAST